MSEGTKKRPRGRPKTFDRARTLEVALESYWREGVEGVSVNEICRRAGISKPGLYREFGGEDLLMDTVLTHYNATVLAPAMATLEEDRPFQDALDSLIGFITREADVWPPGCLFVKMRSSRWRLGPLTRDHVNRLREQSVAGYSGWLERSRARGEIALSVPLEVAATYVDAQVTMLLTQMGAAEDRDMVRAHASLAFASLRHRGWLSVAMG